MGDLLGSPRVAPLHFDFGLFFCTYIDELRTRSRTGGADGTGLLQNAVSMQRGIRIGCPGRETAEADGSGRVAPDLLACLYLLRACQYI